MKSFLLLFTLIFVGCGSPTDLVLNNPGTNPTETEGISQVNFDLSNLDNTFENNYYGLLGRNRISKQKVFTVNISGASGPNAVLDISLSTGNQYRINATDCDRSLEGKTSCYISVVFWPKTQGIHEDQLLIKFEDSESIINLSGISFDIKSKISDKVRNILNLAQDSDGKYIDYENSVIVGQEVMDYNEKVGFPSVFSSNGSGTMNKLFEYFAFESNILLDYDLDKDDNSIKFPFFKIKDSSYLAIDLLDKINSERDVYSQNYLEQDYRSVTSVSILKNFYFDSNLSSNSVLGNYSRLVDLNQNNNNLLALINKQYEYIKKNKNTSLNSFAEIVYNHTLGNLQSYQYTENFENTLINPAINYNLVDKSENDCLLKSNLILLLSKIVEETSLDPAKKADLELIINRELLELTQLVGVNSENDYRCSPGLVSIYAYQGNDINKINNTISILIDNVTNSNINSSDIFLISEVLKSIKNSIK